MYYILKGNYQNSLIFCSGAATCYLLSNLSVVDTLPLPQEIPLAWGYSYIVVSETANFLFLHYKNLISKVNFKKICNLENLSFQKNAFLWKIIDNLYFIIIFVKNYIIKASHTLRLIN